jgi:hypothetical protein
VIVQKLIELGFKDVTDLGSKNGWTLVRVMTSKGWAYERFATVAEVEAWARAHQP